MTPECSHHFAFSYVWPTATNKVLSTGESLHSTLYTVKSPSWTKDDDPSSRSSAKLKNVFKEVHRSHDVFILRTEREREQ